MLIYFFTAALPRYSSKSSASSSSPNQPIEVLKRILKGAMAEGVEEAVSIHDDHRNDLHKEAVSTRSLRRARQRVTRVPHAKPDIVRLGNISGQDNMQTSASKPSCRVALHIVHGVHSAHHNTKSLDRAPRPSRPRQVSASRHANATPILRCTRFNAMLCKIARFGRGGRARREFLAFSPAVFAFFCHALSGPRMRC